MIDYAFEDSSVYEYYVDEVRNVVLEEYNIYKNLTLDEIQVCLKFLEDVDCDTSKVNWRFQRKLQLLNDIYSGNKISNKELGLDFVSNDIEFNLFDSIISLIDLETMIKIRNKLDSLIIDNSNDLMFTKGMFQRFNSTLFAQVVDNNLTEIICLFNNMDVNNIRKLNIDDLINIINDKYRIDRDIQYRACDEMFLNLSKITVDRLCLNEFKNSPEIVFDNLIFITRLEILISYMNKDSLDYLLNYCEMCRDKNVYGIDNVIKFVREKMK